MDSEGSQGFVMVQVLFVFFKHFFWSLLTSLITPENRYLLSFKEASVINFAKPDKVYITA